MVVWILRYSFKDSSMNSMHPVPVETMGAENRFLHFTMLSICFTSLTD